MIYLKKSGTHVVVEYFWATEQTPFWFLGTGKEISDFVGFSVRIFSGYRIVEVQQRNGYSCFFRTG